MGARPRRRERPNTSLTQPDPPTIRRLDLIVLAAIVLVTFVCLLPSLGNGFTNWDDPLYVTGNSFIHDLSLDSAMHLFNTSVRYADNYHPLTALSNAIEYSFAGADPLLYHVDNLVLHLVNVGLVFIFTFFLVFDRDRVITDRERL